MREVGTDPATSPVLLKSALKKPVPNSTEGLAEAAKGRPTSLSLNILLPENIFLENV